MVLTIARPPESKSASPFPNCLVHLHGLQVAWHILLLPDWGVQETSPSMGWSTNRRCLLCYVWHSLIRHKYCLLGKALNEKADSFWMYGREGRGGWKPHCIANVIVCTLKQCLKLAEECSLLEWFSTMFSLAPETLGSLPTFRLPGEATDISWHLLGLWIGCLLPDHCTNTVAASWCWTFTTQIALV